MNNQKDETEWMLQENMDKIGKKIVVMSGKGGVGKSTVSVNLAYGLALQGFSVGLLDVDIHGPSVAKMTGIEGQRLYENEDGRAIPIEAAHNLFVVTVASMLESCDDPIIWRGPAKMGAIKQFLSEISWPKLDYLIVDCPPGTGDEPLSVIQLIGDVTGTVIVSTPQDVSLLDVRKSIKFCEKLSVPVIGIVENMSGFVCPKCGERVDIFKSGGVAKTGKDFKIDVLGNIPIDPNIVHSTDDGKPYIYHYSKTEGGKEFQNIVDKILEKISTENEKKEENKMSGSLEKVAIPVDNGVISEHFGHAAKFIIYNIENKNIIGSEELIPPPHEPGVIPKWLNEVGATAIITGGIGRAAINMFNGFNIKVLSGAPVLSYKEIIEQYLKGALVCKGGECNHNHDHSEGHSCH